MERRRWWSQRGPARGGAECAIAVERRWSCDTTETRFHGAWVPCVAGAFVEGARRRATVHRWCAGAAAGLVTQSLGGAMKMRGQLNVRTPAEYIAAVDDTPVRHRRNRCADSQARRRSSRSSSAASSATGRFTTAMRAAARGIRSRSPATPRTSRCTAAPPARRATSPSGTSPGSRRPASASPACGSRSSRTSTRRRSWRSSRRPRRWASSPEPADVGVVVVLGLAAGSRRLACASESAFGAGSAAGP